jgi:hypothetical protein
MMGCRIVMGTVRIVLLIYILLSSEVATSETGDLQSSQGRTENPQCGPDLTDWLVEEMNNNAGSTIVNELYESHNDLIPGNKLDRLATWADMVGPDMEWDHKPEILEMLEAGLEFGSCPSRICRKTITLCDMCFDFDVPSNIHYSYVGRQAGFRPAVLAIGPLSVQSGSDAREKIRREAQDTPAIKVGFDLYNEVIFRQVLMPELVEKSGQVMRDQLCRAVRRRKLRLKTDFVNQGCEPCKQCGAPE